MKFFQKILNLSILPKVSTKHPLYKAFTLAEVLIVLGIIGIIAEMTIPTLIQNTQNAAMKSGLKVAYSTLSQAFTMLANDNSGTLSGYYSDGNAVVTALSNHLKMIKTCSQSQTNGCLGPVKDYYAYTATDFDFPGFILSNGISVDIQYWRQNCDAQSYYSASTIYSTNWECAYLMVDVNGLKSPNQIAKDIFVFTVKADGTIYPTGSSGEIWAYWKDNECPNGIPTKTNNGWDGGGCTSYVLYN